MGLKERLVKLEKQTECRDRRRVTLVVTGAETEEELDRKREIAAKNGLRLVAVDI